MATPENASDLFIKALENEGVEVIDNGGTPSEDSEDVTVFIDDDRIELACVNPTFPE